MAGEQSGTVLDQHGFIESRYAPEEAAEKLVVECADCLEEWTRPNTANGYDELVTIGARHIDDDFLGATPCHDTRMKAIFADGSEMDVA